MYFFSHCWSKYWDISFIQFNFNQVYQFVTVQGSFNQFWKFIDHFFSATFVMKGFDVDDGSASVSQIIWRIPYDKFIFVYKDSWFSKIYLDYGCITGNKVILIKQMHAGCTFKSAGVKSHIRPNLQYCIFIEKCAGSIYHFRFFNIFVTEHHAPRIILEFKTGKIKGCTVTAIYFFSRNPMPFNIPYFNFFGFAGQKIKVVALINSSFQNRTCYYKSDSLNIENTVDIHSEPVGNFFILYKWDQPLYFRNQVINSFTC